jgi:hypothetical protein
VNNIKTACLREPKPAFFRSVTSLFVSVASVLLVGCASIGTEEQMGGYSSSWKTGDFVGAGASFGGIDVLTAEPNDVADLKLFDLLHVAEAARLSGRPELAIAAYDNTESAFKRYDLENLASTAASQASAVLVNDNVMAYRGYLYEAVLANTYKGLAFLSIAEAENARIEFDRADARSTRAAQYFVESINEQKRAMAEQSEGNTAQVVNASLGSSEMKGAIESEYGSYNRWAVYADFVNPFSKYLGGLHRLATGQFEDARLALAKTAGASSSEVVARDMRLAEELAAGRSNADDQPPRVWVVYDNGVGPQLEEQRIDLPLAGIGDGSVFYAGIALPAITDGTPASNTASVRADDGQSVRTQPVASMKRVMNTEFQARMDGIVFRSVSSAVVKVIAQAAVEEEFGVWGGLIAGAAAAATTQADIRSWRALPARWDVARLDRPDSGQLTISGLGVAAVTMQVPNWDHSLVYVKQTARGAPPLVSIVDLSGQRRSVEVTAPVIAQQAE